MPDDNELVVTPDMQDNYVGAKVYLSFGGMMRSRSVKRRSRDAKGELFGTRNPNPILDNSVFAWGMSPAKYVQEAVRNV